MKTMLCLLLLLCTGCTALPAEERAFAVVLHVERPGDAWRTHARVPAYRPGGEYLTVTGEGATLSAALAAMDAAAPMHLHLSQLRLLTVDAALAASGDLSALLHELSDRADMRPQCAVALTEAPADRLMEAWKPAAGERLSKAIDVLLETRIAQGAVLSATLADIIRMGERQSPVLLSLTLKDGAPALSGGYPFSADMRPAAPLADEETALLSLLLGQSKTLRLNLADGSAEVRDASVKLRLSPDMTSATVELTLRTTASAFTPEGLEARLAESCLALLSRLSAGGCDVLGLGRKAIVHTRDMAGWHDLDWPQRLRNIQWRVSVRCTGPA